MADQKISELIEKTLPVADDLLVLVDTGVIPDQTKKIKPLNLGVGALGASAWVVASNASAKIKTHAQKLQSLGYPVWVCDGTADEQDVLSVFNALPATGGVVLLSDGDFNWASQLNPTDKPNMTLRGQGRATKITLTPSYPDTFALHFAYANTCNYFTMENMLWDINGQANKIVINFVYTEHPVVRNIWVENGGISSGFIYFAQGSKHGLISNIRANNIDNVIGAGTGTTCCYGYTIEQVIATNQVSGGTEEAFGFDDYQWEHTIKDCYIENWNYGIEINNHAFSSREGPRRIKVINNIFKNCQRCIEVFSCDTDAQPNSAPQDIVIANNTFILPDLDTVGVRVRRTEAGPNWIEGIRVEDNIFIGAGSGTAHVGVGIEIGQASYSNNVKKVKVHRNIFRDLNMAGGIALKVAGDAKEIEYFGNEPISVTKEIDAPVGRVLRIPYPRLRRTVKTGDWIFPDGASRSNSQRAIGANQFWCAPLTLQEKCSFDRISVKVQVAGGAGAVIRLGVYTNDNARPSKRLVDSGEIDVTTVGTKEASISLTSDAEHIWVVALSNDATVELRGIDYPPFLFSERADGEQAAWTGAQTYGSLPDTAPTVGTAYTLFTIGLRVA